MAASIRRRDTRPFVDVLSKCARRDMPAEDVANDDASAIGEVVDFQPAVGIDNKAFVTMGHAQPRLMSYFIQM
ncbi:hypothetical protein AOA14_01065 [Sphingopyxis terrae subsp. terrae NBRC 15098]|jgi:hypothetical protein|uniref:Uncharacterized protein n=1 Tax=Sphingopyxis terrae subsp. terrae NBRC 15098 TaxID=1219058 RepID=A0A142VTY4_9SPHN|nr:hypothetical protein AOA14_01065 [Sphingopyxis terrae subsp. terrae NBRC 15098]